MGCGPVEVVVPPEVVCAEVVVKVVALPLVVVVLADEGPVVVGFALVVAGISPHQTPPFGSQYLALVWYCAVLQFLQIAVLSSLPSSCLGYQQQKSPRSGAAVVPLVVGGSVV